jgi:hypothetical protein
MRKRLASVIFGPNPLANLMVEPAQALVTA